MNIMSHNSAMENLYLESIPFQTDLIGRAYSPKEISMIRSYFRRVLPLELISLILYFADLTVRINTIQHYPNQTFSSKYVRIFHQHVTFPKNLQLYRVKLEVSCKELGRTSGYLAYGFITIQSKEKQYDYDMKYACGGVHTLLIPMDDRHVKTVSVALRGKYPGYSIQLVKLVLSFDMKAKW